MAVINRVPKGLLSFFDAKTLGKTPANIEDEVSVSVDATDFYYADIPLEVEIDIASPVTALSTPVSIAIPQGETWLVYEIMCRVSSLNAGATIVGFAPAYSIFGNTNARVHFDSTQVELQNIGDGATKTRSWEEGRLFSYGTVLEGANLVGVAAAPAGVRFDLSVAFRRLTT